MPQHDALNEGQADTGAFELINIVQALKDAKQFMAVLHVESDAVVAYVIFMLVAMLPAADLDSGVLLPTREFERIRNQMVKHLAYHRPITERRRERLEL